MMPRPTSEVTVRRQTGIARRKQAKAARIRGRLRRFKRPKRLTAKQKASVRQRKSSGFFKKIARLRSSLDLPATITGSISHRSDFIDLVLEVASGFKEEPQSAREFATRFIEKDPAFSNTDTGLAAILFEAYLFEKGEDVVEQFVETQLEGSDTTFLAIFEGKLKDDVLQKLATNVSDICTLETLVLAGDTNHADGEVSDMTILEGTPKRQRKTKANTEPKPAPTEGLLPQNAVDYEAVIAEGGISDNAFMYLYPHMWEAARKGRNNGDILSAKDARGATWYCNEGVWLPTLDPVEEKVVDTKVKGKKAPPEDIQEGVTATFADTTRANRFAREIRVHARRIRPKGTEVYYEAKEADHTEEKTHAESIDELCRKHNGKKKSKTQIKEQEDTTSIVAGPFCGDGIARTIHNGHCEVVGFPGPLQDGPLYLESETGFQSKFLAWTVRKEGTDDGKVLVHVGSQVYRLPASLSEVKGLLDRMEEFYEDLPDEFDSMIEAFLQEYCEAEGALLCHEDVVSTGLHPALKEWTSHEFIANRDKRIAVGCRMRRLAMGEDLDTVSTLREVAGAMTPAYTAHFPVGSYKEADKFQRLLRMTTTIEVTRVANMDSKAGHVTVGFKLPKKSWKKRLLVLSNSLKEGDSIMGPGARESVEESALGSLKIMAKDNKGTLKVSGKTVTITLPTGAAGTTFTRTLSMEYPGIKKDSFKVSDGGKTLVLDLKDAALRKGPGESRNTRGPEEYAVLDEDKNVLIRGTLEACKAWLRSSERGGRTGLTIFGSADSTLAEGLRSIGATDENTCTVEIRPTQVMREGDEVTRNFLFIDDRDAGEINETLTSTMIAGLRAAGFDGFKIGEKATTKTVKCPECDSKVLAATGYCVRCKKKTIKGESVDEVKKEPTDDNISNYIRDTLSGTDRKTTPDLLFGVAKRAFKGLTKQQFTATWKSLVKDGMLKRVGASYIWESIVEAAKHGLTLEKTRMSGEYRAFTVLKGQSLVGFLMQTSKNTATEEHPWKAFRAGQRGKVGEKIGFYYKRDGGQEAALRAIAKTALESIEVVIACEACGCEWQVLLDEAATMLSCPQCGCPGERRLDEAASYYVVAGALSRDELQKKLGVTLVGYAKGAVGKAGARLIQTSEPIEAAASKAGVKVKKISKKKFLELAESVDIEEAQLTRGDYEYMTLKMAPMAGKEFGGKIILVRRKGPSLAAPREVWTGTKWVGGKQKELEQKGKKYTAPRRAAADMKRVAESADTTVDLSEREWWIETPDSVHAKALLKRIKPHIKSGYVPEPRGASTVLSLQFVPKDDEALKQIKAIAKKGKYRVVQESIDEGKTLTARAAKKGLRIVSKDNPEWGVWVMRREAKGVAGSWEIDKASGRGSKVLNAGEFKAWQLAESIDEQMTTVVAGVGKVKEPTHMKALARKAGKSGKVALELWGKAQLAANKQYPELKAAKGEGGEKERRYYKVVTAIFKNMLGLGKEESEQTDPIIAEVLCHSCQSTTSILLYTHSVGACGECGSIHVTPTGESHYATEEEIKDIGTVADLDEAPA